MKPFSLNSRSFELGQTNWANKFWGVWGIFGTHFDIVSTLSMFSIIQPLFLQNPHPKSFWDWDIEYCLDILK